MTDGAAARSSKRHSARAVRQPLRQRPKSTPSPSTRTPPAKPGSAGKRRASTRWSAWCGSVRPSAPSDRRGRRGRRDRRRCSPATSPSRAIGAGPTPMPRALRDGWYFTGDTGYVDARRRSLRHRPRRRHDHHRRRKRLARARSKAACRCIRRSPKSRSPALPDERWGKIVAAFVKRRAAVDAPELDAFCRCVGLANFKRPRALRFVAEIPKSPVGKALAPQARRRRIPRGSASPLSNGRNV